MDAGALGLVIAAEWFRKRPGPLPRVRREAVDPVDDAADRRDEKGRSSPWKSSAEDHLPSIVAADAARRNGEKPNDRTDQDRSRPKAAEAWLAWRRKLLTASEAAIVMGCAPSYWEVKTPDQLRASKAGAERAEPSDFTKKLWADGHAKEAQIRDRLNESWYDFQPACFELGDYGASLDGWDEAKRRVAGGEGSEGCGIEDLPHGDFRANESPSARTCATAVPDFLLVADGSSSGHACPDTALHVPLHRGSRRRGSRGRGA